MPSAYLTDLGLVRPVIGIAGTLARFGQMWSEKLQEALSGAVFLIGMAAVDAKRAATTDAGFGDGASVVAKGRLVEAN